ncbi:SlyX family protein [Thalassotalea euphylliae]|uniref:SlyX family protein n=1 Tax=Thalassotalea euphylliae TaxID=1655234 RepID=UPI00362F7B6C
MATTSIDHVKALEERVETLEAKSAFQEDVIEQLNQEIAVHQAQLAQLQEHIELIASRIKDSAPGSLMKQEDEPPPPHY